MSIVLGPLECLTTAPEDYDYGWMKTVQYNVAVDDSGKVYRLARNEDQYHFDNQIARYDSGLNTTIITQKDLDSRVKHHLLRLTPDEAISASTLVFDLDGIINGETGKKVLTFLRTFEKGKEYKIVGNRKVCFWVRGDQMRDQIIAFFQELGAEPEV